MNPANLTAAERDIVLAALSNMRSRLDARACDGINIYERFNNEQIDALCERLGAPVAPDASMSRARELLRDAIDKLEHYANKQGSRRMAGRSFGDGTEANPNEGKHYPAIQSFIQRTQAFLAQPPQAPEPVNAELLEFTKRYLSRVEYLANNTDNGHTHAQAKAEVAAINKAIAKAESALAAQKGGK